MNAVSDTAVQAAIGAAARELRLPTVRAQAQLAEIAARYHATHLGYLARSPRRRTQRPLRSPPRPPHRRRQIPAITVDRWQFR